MPPRFPDHRRHLDAALAHARRAIDPYELTRPIQLPPRNLGVLAVGKAAPAMDAAVDATHGRRLVITTRGTELWGSPEHACLVDHPIPTDANLRAATAAAEFVIAARHLHEQRRAAREAHDAPPDDGDPGAEPLILLLSGGASACLASPMMGLTLDDLIVATRALLASGATIDEINIVRKHVEALKGGRLAALAHPAPIECLVLSDVVSGDAAAVGSGPVSPDPTTYEHARDILRRDHLVAQCPAVTRFIEQGAMGLHPETIKPGDQRLDKVKLRVIGHVGLAVTAAAKALHQIGFTLIHQELGLQGPATDVAHTLAAHARGLVIDAQRSGRPLAMVFGGETTVALPTNPGRGGRNQHLALAAALALDGVEGVALATFATDGVDGPTDAAGAIITGRTAAHARHQHLDLRDALTRHDSTPALDALGCLLKTGPTGTNVNDLVLVLAYPEQPSP